MLKCTLCSKRTLWGRVRLLSVWTMKLTYALMYTELARLRFLWNDCSCIVLYCVLRCVALNCVVLWRDGGFGLCMESMLEG